MIRLFQCLLVGCVLHAHMSVADGLQDLIGRSDIVAIVYINAAEVLTGADFDNCSMAYSATPRRLLKGSVPSGRLVFRAVESYPVGWTYLVFAGNQLEAGGAERYSAADVRGDSICASAETSAETSKEPAEAAIFQLRHVTEFDSSGRQQFFVGPSEMLQLLGTKVSAALVRVHGPGGTRLRSVIQADIFVRLIESRLQ